MEAWNLWLITAVVLLILEMFTPTMFLGSLAIGAFVTSIFAYFNADFAIQTIVFVIISIFVTIFIRPIFKKFLTSKNNSTTNINKYIGKPAKVIQQISNIQNTGRIAIYGEEWTSRSEEGEDIEVDTIVEIKRIESMILYVSTIKEQ